jgi:hypothetical protein
MSERYTQVAVCCEDLQQRCFVHRYLTRKGVNARRIRFRQCPAGDAKQFVRRNHVVEVQAMRARPHLRAGVISMLDADNASVEDRKVELDQALQREMFEPRQAAERIAVLVPRRNIETWIHALMGKAVDETTVYPRLRGAESSCQPAVDQFVRRCPEGMRPDDLPSLRDGCAELTAFLRKA